MLHQQQQYLSRPQQPSYASEKTTNDEAPQSALSALEHEQGSVGFRLPPEIPADAKVEVMYENRSLQAKNGIFGDSFDGFSRHIYRIVK